ncbi:MAG TPA: hypothetical protein VJZ75_05745 [Candidatus Bathyarchaeia archaeon]|nr:hypothetical protein [Candidatus Bathyarchaeia archaeon]
MTHGRLETKLKDIIEQDLASGGIISINDPSVTSLDVEKSISPVSDLGKGLPTSDMGINDLGKALSQNLYFKLKRKKVTQIIGGVKIEIRRNAAELRNELVASVQFKK